MSTRPVPCNLDGWPGITDLVVDYKFFLHVLWSSPSSLVSVIGVGGPGTIERLISAAKTDESVVLEALREFDRRGLVVLDEETREVCIRGWLRFHRLEGRWRTAAEKAFGQIRSARIKSVLVTQEGVKAFFPEKSKAIHANTNTTSTTTTTTTTTPPHQSEEEMVVCGGGFDNLIFEPVLDKVSGRDELIKAILEAGVQDESKAQDLIDELAGVLEAAARGERAGVGNPALWLSVISREFKPARCRQIQERRNREKQAQAEAAERAAAQAQPSEDDLAASAKGKRMLEKWTGRENSGGGAAA